MRYVNYFVEADWERAKTDQNVAACDEIIIFKFDYKNTLANGGEAVAKVQEITGPGLVWFNHYRYIEHSPESISFFVSCLTMSSEMKAD
jgi:hypothetical protein